MQALFHRFTLDSIGEIAFGVSLRSLEDPAQPFVAAFDAAQAAALPPVASPPIGADAIWKNLERFLRLVVPAAELAKLGRGAETLRPGAPVEVVVLLRKRTALGYLLEPLTNQLGRSGSGQ
jgi:hypothetical protein